MLVPQLATITGVCFDYRLALTAAWFWAAAAAVAYRLKHPAGRRPRGRSARLAPSVAVAVAAGAVIAVFYLCKAVCEPVYVASDAPIYHLPFAIEWVQQGRIVLVPTPFGEQAATYFPANISLWYAWLILATGNEYLAKAGQWPFLLLGAIALYGAARLLGHRSDAAATAALAWSLAPHGLFFSAIAIADVAVAGLYLSAVALLLAWRRYRRFVFLVTGGLALGLATGSKLIALLFTGPLAAATLWQLFVRPGARFTRACLFLLALAVPCAYWFARNWLLTGNPVYPTHVALFGTVIFQGWYDRAALATSRYHIDPGNWVAAVAILARLVRWWLLPVLLAAWMWMLMRRRQAEWLAHWIVAALLFWFVNPYQTQERFLLGPLGLAYLPLAALLDRWRWLAPVVAWASILQTALPQLDVWQVLGRPDLVLFPPFPPLITVGWLMTGPVATAGVIAVLLVLAWGVGRWHLTVAGASVVAVGLAIALLPDPLVRFVRSSRPLRFYPVWDHTDGWWALERASPPEGRTVAYAGTNLRYYLYGIGFRNRVVYVNVNRWRGFLMHRFHRLVAERGEPLADGTRPDWDRREPDRAAWLANLSAAGVELLFVTTVNVRGGLHYVHDREGFPIERSWADGMPDRFQRLAWGRDWVLYRVLVPVGEARGESRP